MDDDLIRGYGKTHIIADLSAKYSLPDIVLTQKMIKVVKEHNENANPVKFNDYGQDLNNKIVLVDGITRDYAERLIN